ncbi:hypothetical protein P4055_04875 [Pseudomonas aeruginosa]|nr:hypothetical protein [Pseudomonas aeruginosa]
MLDAQRLHRLPQALGDGQGVALLAVVEQHGELLPAQARGDIQRPPRALPEHDAKLAQGGIAGRMPVVVVVGLEVVDIHQDQRHSLSSRAPCSRARWASSS